MTKIGLSVFLVFLGQILAQQNIFNKHVEQKFFKKEKIQAKQSSFMSKFTKIINGSKAQKRFPFMIKLEGKIPGHSGGTCGAAFIDEKWAITAAHCFPKHANGSWYMSSVVLNYGDVDYYNKAGNPKSMCTEEVSMTSQKIIIHETYDSVTSENDIALIKVEDYNKCFDENYPKPNKVRSILRISNDEVGCEARHGNEETYTVAGWGVYDKKYRPNSVSSDLLHTTVKFVNTKECNRLAGWEIDPSLKQVRNGESWCYNPIQFCAGGRKSDTCQGDSGGPIFGRYKDRRLSGCTTINKRNGRKARVCPFNIYGIVSFGSGCGGSIPGVYVRLSNYADWIKEKTGVRAVKTGLPVGNAVSLSRGRKPGPCRGKGGNAPTPPPRVEGPVGGFPALLLSVNYTSPLEEPVLPEPEPKDPVFKSGIFQEPEKTAGHFDKMYQWMSPVWFSGTEEEDVAAKISELNEGVYQAPIMSEKSQEQTAKVQNQNSPPELHQSSTPEIHENALKTSLNK